jgi:hypothetical protein
MHKHAESSLSRRLPHHQYPSPFCSSEAFRGQPQRPNRKARLDCKLPNHTPKQTETPTRRGILDCFRDLWMNVYCSDLQNNTAVEVQGDPLAEYIYEESQPPHAASASTVLVSGLRCFRLFTEQITCINGTFRLFDEYLMQRMCNILICKMVKCVSVKSLLNILICKMVKFRRVYLTHQQF